MHAFGLNRQTLAALTRACILYIRRLNQMTLLDVKAPLAVTNPHRTMSQVGSSSELFELIVFVSWHICCLVRFHCSRQPCIQRHQAAVSCKHALIKLAAEGERQGLCRDQNRAETAVNTGVIFPRWPETWRRLEQLRANMLAIAILKGDYMPLYGELPWVALICGNWNFGSNSQTTSL